MENPDYESPPNRPDSDPPAADSERFLRSFRRRMARQGVIIRAANPRPDWESPITLDLPADE